jgi:hypothetical protein
VREIDKARKSPFDSAARIAGTTLLTQRF